MFIIPMDEMNAATSADFENMYPDYDAAAAYYGYGENDTTSSNHDPDGGMSGYNNEMSDYFPTEALEDESSSISPAMVPGSPLPADRLARKQRVFVRRGGHCHASLLQSAVMACMSSPKDDEGIPAWDDSDHTASLTASGSADTTATISPRKRLRRTDRPKAVFRSEFMDDDNNNNNEYMDEEGIAGASMLLASLTMSPLGGGTTHSTTSAGTTSSSHPHYRNVDGSNFSRAPPVRRVSRKKSYTSVASGASGDYEDDEFGL